MRPRVVLAISGAVALAAAAWAVLSPTGLPRLRSLEAEERKLASKVEEARVENARAVDDVRILQGGAPESAALLEKAAREELGWVRPDEIVLTGLPTAPAPVAAAPAPAATAQPGDAR